MTEDQRKKQRARVRKWRAENVERAREISRAQYLRHRDVYRATRRLKAREKYAADPVSMAARRRALRLANPEQERITERARYPRIRERKLASHRRWTQSHAAAVRSANRSWRIEHPEEARHAHSARRARKSGNGGSHTLQEWREKRALLGNVCFYCGEAKPLTRDHKIPLVLGGTDDITNILPACARCNSRKYTLTASEFISRRAA